MEFFFRVYTKYLTPPRYVIFIACRGAFIDDLATYSRDLQTTFARMGYYCLTIRMPRNNTITDNDFQRFTHVYSSNEGYTYAEYAKLVAKLCSPDIIILEQDFFSESEKYDALITTSDITCELQDILHICIDHYSVEEAACLIRDYFT